MESQLSSSCFAASWDASPAISRKFFLMDVSQIVAGRSPFSQYYFLSRRFIFLFTPYIR
jgi:hypothetical protein